MLRREGERWLIVATHAADEVVRAEPFDAVELPLGSIWVDVDEEPDPAD